MCVSKDEEDITETLSAYRFNTGLENGFEKNPGFFRFFKKPLKTSKSKISVF